MYKKEGRKEGRIEGHKEVAGNMLRDGMSVDKVSQYTDLPRDELENLLTSD
jgi:predicted transposase/invertase (TIGR01784 family)